MIELRLPFPHSEFEARAFGPFLIIRTRKPTVTVARYLDDARKAELIGKSLGMGDADINYDTDPPRSGAGDRPLALQSLLVARRLFEGGEARRGAPRRGAPATGGGERGRGADEAADQEACGSGSRAVLRPRAAIVRPTPPAPGSARPRGRATARRTRTEPRSRSSWNGGPSRLFAPAAAFSAYRTGISWQTTRTRSRLRLGRARRTPRRSGARRRRGSRRPGKAACGPAPALPRGSGRAAHRRARRS